MNNITNSLGCVAITAINIQNKCNVNAYLDKLVPVSNSSRRIKRVTYVDILRAQ